MRAAAVAAAVALLFGGGAAVEHEAWLREQLRRDRATRGLVEVLEPWERWAVMASPFATTSEAEQEIVERIEAHAAQRRAHWDDELLRLGYENSIFSSRAELKALVEARWTKAAEARARSEADAAEEWRMSGRLRGDAELRERYLLDDIRRFSAKLADDGAVGYERRAYENALYEARNALEATWGEAGLYRAL